MDTNEGYSIRQVSKLTGLSTQLIRKWEERYQAVSPKRMGNGYRIYSAQDIARLNHLQKMIADGYSIGNAVFTLSHREFPIEALITETPQSEKVEEDLLWDAIRYRDQLFVYGERGDSRGIQDVLQTAYSLYGLKFFSEEILIPFLHEVGERWEKGVWSEYQEHLASNAVRDFLIRARSMQIVDASAPLFLAAGLPGERHEIMLHLVLLEANIRGYKTAFLGSSPARSAIEDAVIHLRPSIVVVALTTTEPLDLYPDLLEDLERISLRYVKTKFFIGGPAAKNASVSRNWRSLCYVENASDLFRHIGSFH
nr:MerR family transcriptional regulator [Bacilli bacterium]